VIRAIHHCALRTADPREAAERWRLLWSLEPAGDGDGWARLRSCEEEEYGIELLVGERGHDHTAWELAADVSLDDAEARLRALGVACRREDGALRLQDPAGYGIELLAYRPRDDRRPYEARTGGTAPTAHPRRMGHVNMLCDDAQALARFYVDALGLRISDTIGDGAVWLRCGSQHHELAMLSKPNPHFHHVALELVDFGQLRMTLDHVAQHGRFVTWGPGRHAMARNLFAYVRMPEEDCFVELYCDMELLPDDHEPRAWPDDVHSSNAWGTLPPRTYFRFDEEAIRIERDQLVNLGREFVPA